MDYDALEAAITEKAEVIIPVNLGGGFMTTIDFLKLWSAKEICSMQIVNLKSTWQSCNQLALLLIFPVPTSMHETYA